MDAENETVGDSNIFISTTVIGLASNFIPVVSDLVFKLFYGESKTEKFLRQEISHLRVQLQTISMVDQFASYAKLQRKINSLTQQYKDAANARSSFEQRRKTGLSYILQILVTLVTVWMVWSYRNYPIVTLQSELTWPLSFILCFPGGSPGQVTVFVWLFIMRVVSQRSAKFFTALTSSPKLSTSYQQTMSAASLIDPPLD